VADPAELCAALLLLLQDFGHVPSFRLPARLAR
jgi:hypothetical protein